MELIGGVRDTEVVCCPTSSDMLRGHLNQLECRLEHATGHVSIFYACVAMGRGKG